MRPDLRVDLEAGTLRRSSGHSRTLAQVVAFIANLAQISGAACTLMINPPEPTVTIGSFSACRTAACAACDDAANA